MKRNRKYILLLFALVVLVLCFAVQKNVAEQDTLTYLRQVDGQLESFTRMQGDYPTYLADDAGGGQSYIIETKASGYGGPVTVLTRFSLDGELMEAVIAEHCETPLYLNKVLDAGLLEMLTGKLPGDSFEVPDEAVDGITGATMSAQAILTASQKASAYVGNQFLSMTIQTDTGPILDAASIILLILYAAAAIVMWRKFTMVRPVLLVASVILLGFYSSAFLSYSNFVSLLTGNFPSFAERPAWHVLVFGILAITLISGRNIYCAYLCPFGAVQEGVYRALHLSQITPDPRLAKAAKTVRWVVIWLVLELALLLNQPGIAAYEPFGVFFGGQGSMGQWIIMGLTLILGIWWFKLWCKYFCPVGAILDVIAMVKRKLLRRKTGQERPCPNGAGGKCSGQGCTKKGLAASDKVFLAVLILFNLLIVHTVLSAILALY